MYVVHPIGHVESSLVESDAAPRQGDEGGYEAWLAFRPEVSRGIGDLEIGTEIMLLTWLHRSDRAVLAVHPRSDPTRPEIGVFSTRSPDRPNPIGLHHVRILAVDGVRVQVNDLEAFDGTPIIDVKPILDSVSER